MDVMNNRGLFSYRRHNRYVKRLKQNIFMLWSIVALLAMAIMWSSSQQFL
jgi:hypothetical protein